MKNNFYNLVSTLKNGMLVKKAFVYQKMEKNSEELLNILWNEGFIMGYKILKTEKQFDVLKVFLKYKNQNSVINSIKCISTPGLRVHCSLKNLWKLSFIQGLIIVSTNQGLKTILECKKLKLGGELILLIK